MVFPRVFGEKKNTGKMRFHPTPPSPDPKNIRLRISYNQMDASLRLATSPHGLTIFLSLFMGAETLHNRRLWAVVTDRSLDRRRSGSVPPAILYYHCSHTVPGTEGGEGNKLKFLVSSPRNTRERLIVKYVRAAVLRERSRASS